MYYNFVRIHQSLRITPAMAAGVTDKLWSNTDMVGVTEDREDLQSGALLVGRGSNADLLYLVIRRDKSFNHRSANRARFPAS